MTDPKENTITLYFEWHNTTSDPRQYHQQRQSLYPIYLQPDEDGLSRYLRVAVEIPLQAEFIYNASKILPLQLSGQDAPDPILTPAGMFLAISLLEQPFSESEEKAQAQVESKKQALDDEWTEEGWGSSDGWDDKPSVDPVPDDTPEPDEWDDEEEAVTTNPDEDWDNVIETDESSDETPDWEDDTTWEDE
jgi:hypothetical protein